METLVLDGKEFVKASKAARDLGYTSDYVGQLCRSGSINAHLVGRTWYVRFEELSSHKVEKKRNSRVKAREQAKKSIELHRQKESVRVTPSVSKRNSPIQYTSDETELIPAVRHISVSTHTTLNKKNEEDEVELPKIVIENKGNKIHMHGEIPVADFDDESLHDESVVLKPRIIKSKNISQVEELPRATTIHSVSDQNKEISIQKHAPNFSDRLIAQGVTHNSKVEMAQDRIEYDDTNVSQSEPTSQIQKNKQTLHKVVCVTVLMIVLIMSFSSMLMYGSIRYSTQEYTQFDIKFERDFISVFENIRSKI